MTVLTYNCSGVPLVNPRIERRLRRVAERLLALQPNVIMLQEVWLPRHRRLIRQLLSSYAAAFVPIGGRLGLGGGLCCFSQLPVESSSFSRFSKSGHLTDLTIADRLGGKGFAELRLGGPLPCRCLNVHMTATYRGSDGVHGPQAQLQRQQLRELADAINGSQPAERCLVAGDLNVSVSSSPLLGELLRATGAVDLTPGAAGSSVGHWFTPRAKVSAAQGPRQDYVLYRGPSDITKLRWRYELTEPELAVDHNALLVELNVEP